MYVQTVLEALARVGSPAAPTAVPAIESKMKDKNRLVRNVDNPIFPHACLFVFVFLFREIVGERWV